MTEFADEVTLTNEQILPFVSVVIPTHNRRELLSALLDSLAKQSYPHHLFDINIVHNYTDDGTEELIQLRQQTSDIVIIYSKKNNPTPTPSRQHGGMHAKGKIIAFIDDDCTALPAWIESAVKQFLPNSNDLRIDPNIGVVQGKTKPNPNQARRFLEKTVDIPQQTLFYETCNIFYSKKAFNQVGGFSKEFMNKFYGEDTDLGWKVHKAGYEVKFADNAIVQHHVFHISVWKWLKEPLFFKNLPYLVKKYPEFRQHMFANYFLTIETALFQLVVFSTFLSIFISPWALTLSVPYLVERYKSGNSMPNLTVRVMRILAGLPRSCFTWYALVFGSIKYKSFLL